MDSSDKTICVSFEPSGRTVEVPAGSSVLDAAAAAGIRIRAACGGNGTCGKCLVRLRAGSTVEAAGVSPEKGADRSGAGWLRACRTHLATDATVEVPEASLESSEMRILSADSGVPPAAAPSDPFICVADVAPPAPSREDCRPDAARISAAAGMPLEFPPSVLATLPRTVRDAGWRLRVAHADGKVAAVLPAGEGAGARVLGIAFDLGTTTVVGTLVDLASGEELGVASALNSQIPFGDDVLARIRYARENKQGLEELRAAAIGTLNSISSSLLSSGGAPGYDGRQVAGITIAGNTTMQQLCCGIDPSALGEMPFAPAFADALDCTAGELGLDVNPAARVFIFPQVGGFVGGDTVACMLASDYDVPGEATLLVDIGTNGEIALRLPGGDILCASTAAGPAFEGAKISCGMRGAPGAVDHAWVDGGALRWHVIGEEPARGLCGSGLLDVVAGLLELGVIDETGRMEAGDNRLGDTPVVLTQKDVREVQLAKAAIRAGIELLARRQGIAVADIRRVLLAGAFGNYLDPASACRIGMIPPALADRVVPIGNAAGAGAKLCALSRGEFEYSQALARGAEFLELASLPEFQDCYVDALEFSEDEP